MNCDESRPLLEAYLDGELDLVHSVAIEQHVESCPACRRARKQHEALRAIVRGALPRAHAPAEFAVRLRGALRQESGEVEPAKRVLSYDWRWLATAAAVLVSLAILFPLLPHGRQDPIIAEAVANHVRSLLPGHLTDVASTDRHTVKPWVAQRVDYSPPVQDLSAVGFSLLGARLDYLGQRNVAALVYTCREHRINVFVSPSPSDESERWTSRDGFHVAMWSHRGMRFVVVSDLAVPEMESFTRQLREPTN